MRLRPAIPWLVVVATNVFLLLAATGHLADVMVAAALVPLVLTLLHRPQRGLLVMAALAPFDGLLIVLPHPAYLDRWKEVLLIGTLAAAFLVRRNAPARRTPLPDWWIPLAALMGLSLLSAALVGGLRGIVGLKITFFFVLVFIVARRCPLDARERDLLVTILMLTGLITALYGLAQQVLGAPRLHDLGYEWNRTLRSTGGFLRSFSTFNQPFGFAFFLMLVMLVGIPCALEQPHRLRSKVFVRILPILGLALAFTFVRGAWIGLMAGLTYLAFTRYRVVLLAIPLGAVALVLLPLDVSSAALASSSGYERLGFWQANVTKIAAHPLGVGIAASGSASEKVAELTGEGYEYQPDNYYYKMAYELGVLGLWMFVLMLVATFRFARSAVPRLSRDDAVLARATAAMIVAAAASSFVATYFEIFPMELFFWLLLGVVASCEPASS